MNFLLSRFTNCVNKASIVSECSAVKLIYEV